MAAAAAADPPPAHDEEEEVQIAPKSNVTSRRPRRGELTPSSGSVSRTPKPAKRRRPGALTPVMECPTAEARALAAYIEEQEEELTEEVEEEEGEEEEKEEEEEKPTRAVADGTRWEPTSCAFKLAAVACVAALFLLPADGPQSFWSALAGSE